MARLNQFQLPTHPLLPPPSIPRSVTPNRLQRRTCQEQPPRSNQSRLLIKLMKRWGFVPKRIITDKLRSYGAAKREVAPGLDHWSHKGLNNRAENSHLPFRKRERVMQGFRSPGGLQRFVSMQSATRNRYSVPARRRSALTIRYHRLEAFEAWKSAAHAA